MHPFIDPLLELSSYKKLLSAIEEKKSPVLATGVIDVQLIHLIHALGEHTKRPILLITYDESRAREIANDLSFFREDTKVYPAKDLLFYSAHVHSKHILQNRFGVIGELLSSKEAGAMVLTAEALLDPLPKKDVFLAHILKLEEGQTLSIDTIQEKLLTMGYEGAEQVEGVGQFARRGGILDVFSPTATYPFRIEFWDEDIDSIRTMDPLSQRSLDRVSEVEIFPVTELLYDKKTGEKAFQAIEEEYNRLLSVFREKELTEEAERLQEQIGEKLELLAHGGRIRGGEIFFPYYYKKPESLFGYLPEDTIVFFDAPERIREHMDVLLEEYRQGMESRLEKGYLLPGQTKLLFEYNELLHQAGKFMNIALTTISHGGGDFKMKEEFSFSVGTTAGFQKRMDLFCQEIRQMKKEQYRICILAGGQTRCQRIVSELQEEDIEAIYRPELGDKPIEKGMVLVTPGKISRGFSYRYINFAVFSDKEFLGETGKKKPKKKKKSGGITSFTDIRVGDYVVHESHGIGIFRGIEKSSIGGFQKDYMKISYADGGSLFVPVSQLDMLQKYIGAKEVKPKLNKLGGQEWQKAKAKTRSAVKILAEDLVTLYAKRQQAKGFSYSKDTVWQKEFEEDFPFTETDDQLLAVEDVKRDMEGTGVMDRLLCGDVGYGKTEVALRTAFKAVQDGKQVAYLVPTTILAQQHYNTFVQRMEGYPIKIELLSRFRTPKQQKQSIENLEKGYSDIVIGTHRILSKDVKFKDLGLIIVDEEQRFGVAHKDKMKAMKENLDVLTLSATPIPRTLHMSLSGIRDMSVLEEPPQERHPIETYVMENNLEFVKEAVQRELNRGGQVYYLYNRVEGIAKEAHRVETLLPNARVRYAHGKMTERELENILEDFIQGEIDVLVCTTIIETGLDIPNVNTIIIQDADRLGLSQLYQLRGRVGRSNKIAYAYLLYKRDKVLQEVAEKRLQTIREFTEFGSGFKIAMRDLEIRGAGNLLGAEQHGHMEAVGYEMYCRLLEEEVSKLKGVVQEERFETTLDIDIDAYLPDFYIKSQEQRMEIYKKIANVTTEEDYYAIQEEMEDRFGNLPQSAQALLTVVLMKAYAHRLGITAIAQKKDSILVQFRQDAKIDPQKFTSLISNNKNKYFFTAGVSPYLTIKMDKKANILAIDYIKNMLQELKG